MANANSIWSKEKFYVFCSRGVSDLSLSKETVLTFPVSPPSAHSVCGDAAEALVCKIMHSPTRLKTRHCRVDEQHLAAHYKWILPLRSNNSPDVSVHFGSAGLLS
ncbi:hypothetical protein JOB18_017806 [Solea senegalensis]|uniref:Uncharacterized protein n=1 Tax=Solea senegalensis TaxID=28829 RepID=A0AAV6T6F4_SOLSE|nr:hypothetical protein JOB18_017806 [Solea senegalensis]